MGHQPQPVDDFAEFMTAAYHDLLDAFASAAMHAVVATGMAGDYLSVTRDLDPQAPAVEITDGGMPLPDDPADVTVWTLTTPTRVVRLRTGSDNGAGDDWEPLVRAVGDLLRT